MTGDGRFAGCAAVARLLGGDPAGTASVMTSWLLIERPGPWPSAALESTLADALDDARVRALRAAGLRPLLIRRPGRHARGDEGPVRVFVGSSRPGDRWLERLTVPSLSAIADLDLEAVAEGRRGHGEPVAGPLFLVCTHGAKDVCCAVLGRPVATALADEYPERTWEVSHVGGDRWAGNLLVTPDGFLHGGLDPAEATLVAKSALGGQVLPDHLRGRTSAPTGWEQTAEIAVRRHTGLSGVDDVHALEVLGDSDSASTGRGERTVVVSARSRRFHVRVRYHDEVAADRSHCTGRLALAEYAVVDLRPAGPARVP